MEYQDIAIIGMSGRFPEANSLDEFWQNLLSEQDSIRKLPKTRLMEIELACGKIDEKFVQNGYLDSITKFDHNYFNISEEETKFIDPQHRMTLELVEDAIQNAGYSSKNVAKKIVGVFMAHSKNQYSENLSDHAFGVVNSLVSALSGRVAYSFDFRGPALTIDTACSSSMIALHYACMSLINNESEYAVVGGCHLLVAPSTWRDMETYPLFAKTEKLAAFDKDASGTLAGEGGGVFLLKRLSDALRDKDTIHSIIKGTGVNNDASRSNGLSAPSPRAQTEVIQIALKRAKVNPDSISYVEAHGTGTQLGDPIEIQGITDAFPGRQNPLSVGTVKSNIGHLVGMAGFAGMMKTILSMKHKKIPASLHFNKPNPLIDFKNTCVSVNAKTIDWISKDQPRRAGVSSFGIIGTNGHAILEEAPVKTIEKTISDCGWFIPLSAHTTEALNQQISNLKSFLDKNLSSDLGNISFTLSTGREHFKKRAMFIATDVYDLIGQLESYSSDKITLSANNSAAFIFPCSNEKITPLKYQTYLDNYYQECLAFNDSSSNRVFAYQYAVMKHLDTLGVRPKAISSIGNGPNITEVIKGRKQLKQVLGEIENSPVDELSKVEESMIKIVEQGFNTIVNFDVTVNPFRDNQAYNQCTVLNIGQENNEWMQVVKSYYLAGTIINWEPLFDTNVHNRLNLPTYAYERKAYFLKNNGYFSRSEDVFDNNMNNKIETNDGYILKIKEIFSNVLSDELNLEVSFESNGGDSLSIIQALESIKGNFQIDVPMDLFYETQTLNLLINIIEEMVQQSSADRKQDSSIPTRKVLEEIFQLNFSTAINFDLNFEDNGGDSIALIELNETIKKEFNLDLPIEVYYESSSINGIIDVIRMEPKPEITLVSPSNNYSPNTVQLNESAPLEDGDILLLGATGFLGMHILHDLLNNSVQKIHCIVRGKSQQNSILYFKEVYQHYFSDDLLSSIDSRLVIINGDIGLERFGLSKYQYDQLAKDTSIVINSAADVKQIGNKSKMWNVNVNGTMRAIDFCMHGKTKELHHCSTYVVSGRIEKSNIFLESDLSRGQTFLGNIYSESKYEAELLIEKGRMNGLHANVYRIGNLTGRFNDGVFQKNPQSSLLNISLEVLCKLGYYPDNLSNSEIEISPVDTCADAISKIIRNSKNIGQNFHLMCPIKTPYGSIFEVLNKNGHKLMAVTSSQFNDIVDKKRTPDKTREWKTFDYFYSNPNESNNQKQTYDTEYCFEKSLLMLNQVGFSWPQLDETYLTKIIRQKAI